MEPPNISRGGVTLENNRSTSDFSFVNLRRSVIMNDIGINKCISINTRANRAPRLLFA